VTLRESVLVAALKSAARGSAADDLVARAEARFPDGADDAAVSAFVESLRPEAPHLFIPSVGSGAVGSRRGRAGTFDRTAYLTPEEFGANAEKIARGKAVR